MDTSLCPHTHTRADMHTHKHRPAGSAWVSRGPPVWGTTSAPLPPPCRPCCWHCQRCEEYQEHPETAAVSPQWTWGRLLPVRVAVAVVAAAPLPATCAAAYSSSSPPKAARAEHAHPTPPPRTPRYRGAAAPRQGCCVAPRRAHGAGQSAPGHCPYSPPCTTAAWLLSDLPRKWPWPCFEWSADWSAPLERRPYLW